MSRLHVAGRLAGAVLAVAALSCPGPPTPAARAVIPPVLDASAPVAAEPTGPPEPVEQRTHCAALAPLGADEDALPPGHLALDVAGAWQFSRGAGVKVAVLDTGVTPHPRLPRLTGGGDYVGSGDGLTDCDLHGTLVAGIIAGSPSGADGFAGVAPDASIISVRTSSGAYAAKNARSGAQPASVGAGFGSLRSLAKAIVRAVDLGAKVVNISEVACASVGSGDPLTTRDSTASRELGSALARAKARDAVIVVAAGNVTETTGCREQNPAAAASPTQAWTGVRTVASPAWFGREVLTVGAVDADTGSPADFSLRGPWVTVAAPGTRVTSLAPAAGGVRPVDALEGDDGPRALAGTSYAAPYVAGLAALIRARYPKMPAGEVVARIVRTAHGGPERDASVGYGVVDPIAALTAELPDAGSLPDPADDHRIAAPATPPPPGHGPAAAAVVAAVCAAMLAVCWLVTRQQR
ncbi:MAG: type VII secretion-associated serine protease mycosin [Gordonia sp. (in: high G+C Gram-positive bacteria)]